MISPRVGGSSRKIDAVFFCQQAELFGLAQLHVVQPPCQQTGKGHLQPAQGSARGG
jgi:hypothetical protein